MSETKETSQEKHTMSQKNSFLDKVRKNPWMLSTVALALVLVLTIAVGGVGTGLGSSKTQVATNVVSYLNGQTGGGVVYNSVSEESGLYKIMVTYQGSQVPVYATIDGKNLISDVIPLTGGAVVDSGLPSTANPVTVELGDAPVLGDANAPVTIVEFSDYQCPFCERAYTQAIKPIKENYIASGQVKLVYMDFPLSFHPEAAPAAEAARCFREVQGNSDDEYFKFHDKLFENQATLSDANYKKWARELGANGATFDTCLDSGKYADEVQADMAYGSSLGVTGTPGFFINGIPVTGAQPYSVFEQIIESELAKLGA